MASACALETSGTDDFQVVRRKKGKRQQKQLGSSQETSLNVIDDSHVDLESLKRRVNKCRDELLVTEFYSNLLKTLERAVDSAKDSTHNDTTTEITSVAAVNSSTHKAETKPNIDRKSTNEHTPETSHGKSSLPKDARMLVYGLGNFASCVIARYQLALVLALRQHWQVATSKCEMYDPKFSELETGMLQDLGCSVLQQNEEGKRRMQGVTIVLMPHCGKALFNNLLWANWSPRQLQQMVVMGNSFSNMVDSIPERLWKKHINYVSLISPHCTEEAVNNTFTHTDIFNDLSVHWFPASRLLQLPAHTWSHAPQPVYDATDLEIIVNSSS
ncbi:SRR1-like protein [Littorina saxatilis]|uniref:SRR1-like domain-containing protein n=1 Tax=Littorina saxatilis TaxID=31220 RepID=A0AAN9AKT2_9CAEN